jgi:magnesium transporter
MTKKASFKGRRKRRKSIRLSPPGTPPETLYADPEQPKPKISLLAYSPLDYTSQEITSVEQISPYLQQWPVVWINVDGLGDADTVRQMGALFGFHGLSMEDVLNLHQRPKVEDYDDHYYLVAHMASLQGHVETEQISFFIGKNFVVTFQAKIGDCFDSIRLRIAQGKGKIRVQGADYLAYLLIDSVIDNYFPLLEKFGEEYELLEDEIFLAPSRETLGKIHSIKHDLRVLRRAVWPLREAVNFLLREPPGIISDNVRLYLRDCYDHTVRVIDLIENYRELGADLSDIYLSNISLKMNEVIKVLTIISTIFIPLTFIVGVYGMNFDRSVSAWSMPELGWKWGYAGVWAVMLGITLAMLYFFKRKGWFGTEENQSSVNNSQN